MNRWFEPHNIPIIGGELDWNASIVVGGGLHLFVIPKNIITTTFGVVEL